MSDSNNVSLADTYSLKGFVSIGAFADNDRYETAPLGELSLYSATYAKDRALYYTTSAGNNPTSLELSVFSSRTTAQPAYTVPVPFQSLMLSMIQWMHSQAVGGTFNTNAETCRQLLQAEFDGKIVDALVGQMTVQDGVYLPASITFYVNIDGLGATWSDAEKADLARSRIKLWFADAAFGGEYDEFNLEFVPPIAADRLDDFFLLSDQVKTKIDARTMEETMILIHQVKNGMPETKIRTLSFLYHDPNDRTWTLPTNWTFVIYGAAGDNVDSIKEGLANWILANSTHTREEWAVIFPDIFTSTEFIITPLWSNLAIPNSTIEEGVYSPSVNALAALATARRSATGTGYTQEHIDTVLSVVGCTYKSLSLLVVGGPENRDAIDRFEEQWPDYIAVFTSSLDFDRMKPETQAWVTLLNAMLKVAEEMTEFSDMPQNMTRLKRTNAQGETFMYVVSNYGNVQYLVASRQSVQQYFPPASVDALQITTEGAVGLVAMPNADIAAGEYSTQFVAVGGEAPYVIELVEMSDTYRMVDAEIDPDTGVFTGSPEIAGDVQVTVKVTDANSTVASKVFTLHVYTTETPEEE
ncbi:hypothetical protein LUCX_318 [Xanthomonas phage vB_XciM_LucasX]|nr:hypothetical protein LUCX_318 [Xanthomonas phage vB_XciM_LucasX]